ncbi:hypothetical protein CDAR_426031 [Caerostris darwini]|uniref:Uncharacterized protein n=1 Tax=Caerostris darwini TaxID=1538125 RepID=A0AAV4T5U0_9ARAC|nr:hypothetical protein CDAR_426031 [Caerostris darwini]
MDSLHRQHSNIFRNLRVFHHTSQEFIMEVYPIKFQASTTGSQRMKLHLRKGQVQRFCKRKGVMFLQTSFVSPSVKVGGSSMLFIVAVKLVKLTN